MLLFLVVLICIMICFQEIFLMNFYKFFYNCEICASELQLLLLQCFHEFSLLSGCYSQQKG